ncbi:F-box domain-containing protein [Mycena indigotica]|uniref:F-box domain-containing protein n=1 Tax=Mycena indigotica TaxID=2126181 RepID=A0A8H6SH31_9AGAR|nr:F-box domain-containing protein [Mycena indigotica]KAF7299495.1 F-box domain-containing protein [Mycena indigotica]
MQFLDLPLELLSDILFHLVRKSQYLFNACLVNKIFEYFATPHLYARVSIFAWQKQSKAKRSHSLIRRYSLEIRDFPKSFVGNEDIESVVVHALRNCINLESCTWTRDGSLTSDILQVLSEGGTLRELEINGRSDSRYDPRILTSFTILARISLIMPSRDVVALLPTWIAQTTSTLRSLTLICKMSIFIDDAVLKNIAPNVPLLEQLSLTGCPAISHEGISAMLSHNVVGIRSLSLEGLPKKFVQHMHALSVHLNAKHALSRLVSFTLSLHSSDWLVDILSLLHSAPLERIQLYGTHGRSSESSSYSRNFTKAADSFWTALLSIHSARLTRVSVHRMPISLRSIREVCLRCTALRQLFVVVEPSSLNTLADYFMLSSTLAEVHVNFVQHTNHDEDGSNTDSLPQSEDEGLSDWEQSSILITPQQALSIVRRCPETIELFGCNTRVWQVERVIHQTPAGELVADRVLAKYDQPDVPEQFLVVRT